MKVILRPHFKDHYLGVLIEAAAFNNNNHYQFSFIEHVLHTMRGSSCNYHHIRAGIEIQRCLTQKPLSIIFFKPLINLEGSRNWGRFEHRGERGFRTEKENEKYQKELRLTLNSSYNQQSSPQTVKT